MEEKLDNISIELLVTAAQSGEKIWMQGDLEIIINGEKPYGYSDMVDLDELLKSLNTEGAYFIFSCICGVPECGGWYKGIKVEHQDNRIKWLDQDKGGSWSFEKKEMLNDLKSVREEEAIYRQYFKGKEIDYVGLGFDH